MTPRVSQSIPMPLDRPLPHGTELTYDILEMDVWHERPGRTRHCSFCFAFFLARSLWAKPLTVRERAPHAEAVGTLASSGHQRPGYADDLL